MDQKLPVHIILGAADYQKIRSTDQPVLRANPDSAMLGWMFFGRQMSISKTAEKGFFSESSQQEFDTFCNLEALGLIDLPQVGVQFHKKFSKNLPRTKSGYYESKLPWKPDHPKLPCNKELATARLRSTIRKL